MQSVTGPQYHPGAMGAMNESYGTPNGTLAPGLQGHYYPTPQVRRAVEEKPCGDEQWWHQRGYSGIA